MSGFDFPMENNVSLSHILSWSNDILKNKPLTRELVFDFFNKGAAYSKLDSLAGQSNPIFQKWLSHPAYDSYWQSMLPSPDEYAITPKNFLKIICKGCLRINRLNQDL